MISGRKEKTYICSECGFQFSNLDVPRTCSNCFACTGCEIYLCPSCQAEVLVRPIKKMQRTGSSSIKT